MTNPTAFKPKLTPEQRDEIINGPGNSPEVAARFGISESWVCALRRDAMPPDDRNAQIDKMAGRIFKKLDRTLRSKKPIDPNTLLTATKCLIELKKFVNTDSAPLAHLSDEELAQL